MNRRLAPVVAALVVLSMAVGGVTPAAAALGASNDGLVLSSAIEDQRGWLGGYTPGEDVVRYGVNANPGWVIFYEDGHADDLESWATSSSDRVIQANSSDSNYMVISAPANHVGLSRFSFLSTGTSLLELGYVEKVGVNRRLEIDPISGREHKTKSAWNKPSGAFFATNAGLQGEFSADGAAWSNEINTSSLESARDAIEADAVASNGTGVRVAIIDTGLDYSRALYGSRVVAGKNVITNETLNITDPTTATASDYEPVADGSSSNHGSWIATAIAGNGSSTNATGVAPGAELVPVKALGDDGSGTTGDIAEGLEYACGQANADVVSMSLGSPLPSAQLEAEITECLEDDGVTAVVVAAGNSRLTYRYVASPADETGVVTVAASDVRAINESESAYFSNVGPDPETGKEIDVAAPGMKITAETADGNVTLSGTSMATPLVAGSIALAVDANPGLRGQPEEVRVALQEHAEPMPAAGTTEVGHGRINARLLVEDTQPATDQAGARSTAAESRDTANQALAGSFWRTAFDSFSFGFATAAGGVAA